MSLNSFPNVKTMSCSGAAWRHFSHHIVLLVSFCSVVFVPQNYYTISNCSSPASELCEWTKENRPLDDWNFKITKPCIFLDILKKTEIWLSMLFLGKVIFVEEGSAINHCGWTWVDPPSCEEKPLEYILSAQEGSPAITLWNRDGLDPLCAQWRYAFIYMSPSPCLSNMFL